MTEMDAAVARRQEPSDARPLPESAQATVDRFHELYYESSDRTWRNTWWMGTSVQKCPLDLWIYQEILYEIRPDVIVESGTYGGGSALFLASICDLIDHGRIYTIDIREHGGMEPPAHPRVEYLQGSSIAEEVLAHIRSTIAPGEKVLVILDSDHSREHVLRELEAYAPLVTPGSYLIVEDTNVNGHPVLQSHGPGPMEALHEFVRCHPEFETDQSLEKFLLTFNPRGYLRRTGHGNVIAERPRISAAKDALKAFPYDMKIDTHVDSVHGRTLRLVGAGRRVLELGCATGYLAQELLKQRCSVVGVDINGSAAEKASEVCERVIEADLSQPGWENSLNGEMFDVIVANDVLEHLPDPPSCLRVLRRFIRPGGFVVVSVPNVAHASVRLSLLAGAFDYRDAGLLDRTHLRFFTRRGIEELFDGAGYGIRTIETVHRSLEGAEIAINQDLVPADLAQWLSEDEEATTYQFVVVAAPLRHGTERLLRERVRRVIGEMETLKSELRALAFPRAGNVDLGILDDNTRRAVLELRARIVDLNRQLSQRSGLIERIQHEYVQYSRDTESLRDTFTRKEAEVRVANEYAERVSAEATRYAESLKEALNRAEEGWRNAHHLLSAAEQRIARLDADLQARERELFALQEQQGRQSADIEPDTAELRRRAEAAEQELAAIHSSRLWRAGSLYWRARKAIGIG